jgi:rubrerythrin
LINKGETAMANLTSKELTAIEDTLSMEQNVIKKYTMYASQASDSAIKQQCKEITKRHQDHVNTLMGHLG